MQTDTPINISKTKFLQSKKQKPQFYQDSIGNSSTIESLYNKKRSFKDELSRLNHEEQGKTEKDDVEIEKFKRKALETSLNIYNKSFIYENKEENNERKELSNVFNQYELSKIRKFNGFPISNNLIKSFMIRIKFENVSLIGKIEEIIKKNNEKEYFYYSNYKLKQLIDSSNKSGIINDSVYQILKTELKNRNYLLLNDSHRQSLSHDNLNNSNKDLSSVSDNDNFLEMSINQHFQSFISLYHEYINNDYSFYMTTPSFSAFFSTEKDKFSNEHIKKVVISGFFSSFEKQLDEMNITYTKIVNKTLALLTKTKQNKEKKEISIDLLGGYSEDQLLKILDSKNCVEMINDSSVSVLVLSGLNVIMFINFIMNEYLYKEIHIYSSFSFENSTYMKSSLLKEAYINQEKDYIIYENRVYGCIFERNLIENVKNLINLIGDISKGQTYVVYFELDYINRLDCFHIYNNNLDGIVKKVLIDNEAMRSEKEKKIEKKKENEVVDECSFYKINNNKELQVMVYMK